MPYEWPLKWPKVIQSGKKEYIFLVQMILQVGSKQLTHFFRGIPPWDIFHPRPYETVEDDISRGLGPQSDPASNKKGNAWRHTTQI